MDYSKLSDQEINKLVAFALGCKEVVPDIFMDDVRRYEFDKPKNKSGNKFYFAPCNNPSDAWPIIEKYRISFLDQLTEWCVDAKGVSPVFEANPLRGAMIVFLMMQDSANVPANPTRSDIR